MPDSLSIPLRVKTDRNGDKFLVGSFDFPVLLDMSKISFFVFYPPEKDGDTSTGTLMIRPKDFKPRHRAPSDSTHEQE
jgi:hypothetical protein